MAPEADEQQEVQKPKSSKKLLILIVMLLLVLAGGGAGAYFMFFKAPPAGDKAEGTAAKTPQQPVIQDMETFLVNLSDQGGKRFLKLTMKTKVSSMQASEEFKARHFEMRDLILMILTSKEAEDITRPEDKLNLKKEIIAALNRALQKGQVQDVYFTEFLIQ